MRTELFAHEIQEEILKRQPLIVYSTDELRLSSPVNRHIFIATDNARFEKLFTQHGGTIISHEVFRRQKAPLPIVEYLRKLVNALLELEKGQFADDLQKRYTIQICTALSSVYYKQLRWRLFLRDYSEIREPDIADDLPAALAATGKLQELLDLVSGNPDRLKESCSCLSSPLEAAAACDQVHIVKTILDIFSTHNFETDKMSQHFWPYRNDAIHKRVKRSGLTAAIRKGAKESGNILLDQCLPSARPNRSSWTQLTKEVARYTDKGFMKRVLEAHKYNVGKRRGLEKIDAVQVLKEGSCSVLRAVIQDGYLDPNEAICDVTPLALVVTFHRYDLARVLIQHGAYVDGVPDTGKPVTALWHAARAGYRGYGDDVLPGVKFLIRHGADPDFGGDWRSPLQAVEGLWPDVQYLLRQAKDHGQDVALSPETWRKYEERPVRDTPVVVDQNAPCGVSEHIRLWESDQH
jgi:hypothetical protein